ncbi:MAG: GNAT family N-acetyltransferase [Rhodobacteraceae bacterium]|jgi:predicted N-acetyltransferase YhbS/uncharacterized glyoxalase superfamily protein PhnB|nr:GNAT family N-acetyltransferase [Paracoccaceae bacterium]
MIPQRVTLLTLGVADLPAARAFYARLGWVEHRDSQPGVAFFQLNGQVLALFGRADLAADQGRPGAMLGSGALTLAQNFATEAEVDAAYAAALAAGGTALKAPAAVFWGGYSGYWADADGHVWEVARNPFWPLAADGSLTLPGDAETLAEAELTPETETAIADLLSRCFAGFDGRSYHQIRHGWRHLIREDGRIAAHVAVQLRAVRLGDRLLTVGALAEVATDPSCRGRGLAGQLVQAALQRLRTTQACHALLFGTAALYAATGFRPVRNPMIWADMQGARTGAIRQERAESLMVLTLTGEPWDEGATLDLLGPLF